jgi:5'-nucleotidase
MPIVRTLGTVATFAACALAALLAGCATPVATEPVKLRVLAINDFHGNLRPARGGIRIADPAAPGRTVNADAGGAEHLATAVAELRKGHAHSVFVAAGDLIGASPLLSALFRDEPTIESLSLMGLELSAVGNHEFDKGAAELLRMQNGGCHAEGCKGPNTFRGASFQYLAASTVDTRTGRTLLPPYSIKRYGGIPVAFIGLTLEATPTIVVPAGVAGLRFRPEAQTVNELVPELKRQGVEAIVVLIHEGGVPVGDYNECPGISGPIVDIVKALDKAVDVVVSGHTHRAYNCRIDGRPVTSADKYGSVVTTIDLVLDPTTRDVTSAVADNVIVRPSFMKDSRQTALIEQYEQLVTPLAKRVVGRAAAPMTRRPNPAGESPLGQLIADAQLAATRDAGAQVAFMNPGGMREDLQLAADGQLRYEDLFAAQPFYNNLVTMTLTGAQLVALLEQQWSGQPAGSARLLSVSQGFSYSWDNAQPVGQRVVPGSVRLAGRVIPPDEAVRITVNSFIASGGDNFVILKQGKDVRTGMMDVDALEAFVKAGPPVGPGPLNRITRLN